MTDRELMQQALVALGAMQSYAAAENKGLRICDEAIEALRARLAQPDPYAAQAALVDQQTQGRMYVDPVTGDVGIGTVKWDASAPLVVHPHPAFQATQPQEWKGLTDEEMFSLWVKCPAETEDRFAFARAIEQALKEKNHG